MNPSKSLRKIVPLRSQLRGLKNELQSRARKGRSEVLTLPYAGSAQIETRIILHPGEYFTWWVHRYFYRLLGRSIVVPVTIRSNLSQSEPLSTSMTIAAKPPFIFQFKSVLAENGLPRDGDYTFEFPVKTTWQGPPLIELQMKHFDGPMWGALVADWPNFRKVGGGFVMLNPKFKISDRRDTLAVFSYHSSQPELPETATVRYVVCDEKGRVVVRNERQVHKNCFITAPTLNERELLDGNYSMFAQSSESMAGLTLNRDLQSKAVTLEHTQPLQKYSVTTVGRERVMDLKNYWYERVAEL